MAKRDSYVRTENGLVIHHIANMTAQTSKGDVTVNVKIEYRPRNAAWLALDLLQHAILAWLFDDQGAPPEPPPPPKPPHGLAR